MPLNGDELQDLARVANSTVKDLINSKSQAFKKLKPDLAGMQDPEVIQLINSEPRIMRRPVLSDGQRIVIGFSEKDFITMLS
jgi:arsenate reductase-like glutaredoxin family protein